MARAAAQHPVLVHETGEEGLIGETERMEITQDTAMSGLDTDGAPVEISIGGQAGTLLGTAELGNPVPITQGPAAPANPIPGLQYPYPTPGPMQLVGSDQPGDPRPEDQDVPSRCRGPTGPPPPNPVRSLPQNRPGSTRQCKGTGGKQPSTVVGIEGAGISGRHIDSSFELTKTRAQTPYLVRSPAIAIVHTINGRETKIGEYQDEIHGEDLESIQIGEYGYKYRIID